MGVTGSSSGGGRTSRALRYLLLFVLALAAVEYLFGSLLDTSPLKTYLYMPIYNTTSANISSRIEKSPRLSPKHILAETDSQQTSVQFIEYPSANTYNPTRYNSSEITTTVSNSTMVYNAPTPAFITKIIESIHNNSTEDANSTEVEKNLCQENMSEFGPITVNKTEIELKDIEKLYPDVFWGGRYAPPECKARHRVAIIVPYRDRQQHLAIFLKHMHPFLMKQQLEYGIFIVEQSGQSEFNRAKLMNVGFMESERLKAGGWQCFIFHDIDLLPLDERNMYSCPRQPRHMSASIDVLHFKLPYEDIFGGVSAMTKDQFTSVNGFSNKYWGWGGEDDDMFYRLKKKNYHIARYKMSIARYAMLEHKKSSPNPKRYQLLSQTSKTFLKDGLTTLEYEVVKVRQYHLYTHILVNIDESS